MSVAVFYPHCGPPFILMLPYKGSSDRSGTTVKKIEEKEINGFIPLQDKTLLGFNYFLLEVLWVCLPLDTEVKTSQWLLSIDKTFSFFTSE